MPLINTISHTCCVKAAGTVNVKVTAIAKVTGTTGSDSVKIVVEGVVLGKKVK